MQLWLNAGRISVVPQLFASVQVLVCVLFAQEDQPPQFHDSVQRVGTGGVVVAVGGVDVGAGVGVGVATVLI